MRILKKLSSHLQVMGSGLPPKDSPDELLGDLFRDVQLRRIFPDGQTFVDLVPQKQVRTILKAYKQQRHNPNFDLDDFVRRHFAEYLQEAQEYTSDPKHTIEEHINELWPILTRENYKRRGSLLALPYPYIVPGGRFTAQYYWDSYFTMLGLVVSGRHDLVEGMTKNCAYMLRKFGVIPNASRTYFLSRSQPPVFAYMVRLLAKENGKSELVRYLPYLLVEYRFWMKGSKKLDQEHPAINRVMRMPDGEILNRYYDDKSTPRPESYKEDVDTSLLAVNRVASKTYVDLRAGAESGWDFSSRWCTEPLDLATTRTTDVAPVDLNVLLVNLERTIADAYRVLKQNSLAARFEALAKKRTDAVNKYCWDEQKGFFFDYDLATQKQSECWAISGVFPLFVGCANQAQADAVATNVQKKFLKPGGVVTTLTNSGQQWDSPNGWAPLQWTTIQGLRKYGKNDLADEIKKRWIATNLKVYKEHAKLVEKYDVVNPGNVAGGGEYTLQDGFGWTNGILLALLHEDKLH